MRKQKPYLNLLEKDLRENGPQQSWDWEADYRFAKMIEFPDMKTVEAAVYGGTVWPIREAALISTGITKKRISALRELEKMGVVKSHWIGSGEGGWSEFGVRRFRSWEIV